MRIYISLIVLLFSLLLFSCDPSSLFEENVEVPGALWHKDSSFHFTFEITDTVSLYNFYMNVRNSESYGYSNLYTFNELSFPNGKKAVDTLECTLSDPTGRWYGKGLGDLYESRHIYKEGIRFPLTGTYHIRVFQAMRTDQLNGINDIGIRIGKYGIK
ncbi:MAG: gliding motility lipoprotein GldH [Flavobacteriales bacterium]|nr:gliding motility lipoprotein GldH [Flavobacteriales bacterium]